MCVAKSTKLLCVAYFYLCVVLLYDAVLSMVPHTRLYFQLLCACLSTSLPFAADDSFSVSSIFVLSYITAAAAAVSPISASSM